MADNQEQAIIDAFKGHETAKEAENAPLTEQNEPETDNSTVETPEFSSLEQEAYDMGWRPKDEFLANGGDESRFVPPNQYIKFGRQMKYIKELERQTKDLKSDFEGRIESLNKMHQAELDIKLKQLERQQKEAVELADVDKYNDAKEQIEQLQETRRNIQPTQQPAKDPLILEWESKNEWIMDQNDPRTIAAQGFFNNYATAINPSGTVKDALAYVDSQMDKLIPKRQNTNQLRNLPSGTETATGARKKSNGHLSMNDLTQDERMLWQQAGFGIWGGDESKFLKSVADSRRR